MKTSVRISKLKGVNISEAILLMKSNYNVNIESSDKNIYHFTFEDNNELNRVTFYSMYGKVDKIRYNYNSL